MTEEERKYMELEMDKKDIPVKIKWSETARGFYCPTCRTGTVVDAYRCDYCGQLLLPYLNI